MARWYPVVLRNFLASLGLAIASVSDASRVSQLLNQLRPIDSGIPLVRIGSAVDGGYLVPDDFDQIDGVVSPGGRTVV